MSSRIRKKISIVIAASFFLVGIVAVQIVSAYIPTNRDTKLPPDKVTYDITVFDEYELLYETNTMRYYYREDRDIIAIEDKRNGYTWKTGLDIPFSDEVEDALDEAETEEEIREAAVPMESGFNTTYIGIANSLVTIEYFDAETIKNIASAAEEDVTSTLYTLNDNKATRRLDVDFTELDIQIKVYITFMEDTISYYIKYEEITGEGKNILASIMITPFLGASGGMEEIYNPETGKYDKEQAKYRKPGYIFVPDGSGSLIRFMDNTSAFNSYIGDVYGKNPAEETYYYDYMTDAIPVKSPVMPVFGIAHGDGQAAFVAYAESGAEYMDIIVSPEESKKVKHYTWGYPRFEYNNLYFQVYNQKGAGYFTTSAKPFDFDIHMNYTFIAGDGSDGTPAADYTGMAKVYRQHLIDTGVLTPIYEETDSTDIPIRLDFIMADSKKGIIGTEEVVVTTTEDVRTILDQVIDVGIQNVNTGLIGWQKDGEIMAKPYKLSFSGTIGSKNEFKNLINDFNEIGIDISYSRDFVSINSAMMNDYGNAARHMNSWYLILNRHALLPENAPVLSYGYATPVKSSSWMKTLADDIASYSNSITATGISNTLISNYDRDGLVTSLTEAIGLYESAMSQVNEKMKINLENPNMYLWKYTDRYLQAPVGGSQYIFETDTVPFLQLVLNGTMELYAPYSNFSFYTQKDILRMIDYNLYPSFILSKEPSYYLADTASADLYSTEFEQYEQLIQRIYSQVNDVLGQVKNYEWVDRTVVEDGVIMNHYQKGSDKKQVIINYTQDSITYENENVPPYSAVVR